MKPALGFQVVVEMLLMEHPGAVAVELDEDGLKKDLAEIFQEVIVEKLPEFAESRGYSLQDLQIGVNLYRIGEDDDADPAS